MEVFEANELIHGLSIYQRQCEALKKPKSYFGCIELRVNEYNAGYASLFDILQLACTHYDIVEGLPHIKEPIFPPPSVYFKNVAQYFFTTNKTNTNNIWIEKQAETTKNMLAFNVARRFIKIGIQSHYNLKVFTIWHKNTEALFESYKKYLSNVEYEADFSWFEKVLYHLQNELKLFVAKSLYIPDKIKVDIYKYGFGEF